jgi:site-specific DNA-methyltransferase (adenine-specific)
MSERDTNFQEPTNPALNIASVSRCPSINFFNVDCIEFMKSKPDKFYDLAIVDPPYGIDIADWDTKEHKPTAEYFEQLFRVSKNQIIWGANYFELPHSEAWICWDKTLANGKTALGKNCKSEFELAWTNYLNIKSKILRYTYDGNIQGFKGGRVDYKFKSIHPTQKPVDLYRWLLQNYAKPNDKILDTHGGSFNHAIAAEIEGFDLDIMDIDTEYFQAGVNAFNLHKRQQRLF